MPQNIGGAFSAYKYLSAREAAKRAKLFSYYIEKGFPHRYIEELSYEEREFYLASMELWEEKNEEQR